MLMCEFKMWIINGRWHLFLIFIFLIFFFLSKTVAVFIFSKLRKSIMALWWEYIFFSLFVFFHINVMHV